MAAYFLDTSGLVKRYVAEIGTAWVTSIMAPAAGNLLHVSRLTGVEVVSALARRARARSLSAAHAAAAKARFQADFTTRFHIVGITVALVKQAMALAEAHGLRGYDAVQLAAALQAQGRYFAMLSGPLPDVIRRPLLIGPESMHPTRKHGWSNRGTDMLSGPAYPWPHDTSRTGPESMAPGEDDCVISLVAGKSSGQSLLLLTFIHPANITTPHANRTANRLVQRRSALRACPINSRRPLAFERAVAAAIAVGQSNFEARRSLIASPCLTRS
jgi:uncharacterized protein